MAFIPSIVAAMEKRVAAVPLLVSIYSRIYNDVINKEIALAGIGPLDRVLNVGCGGIPFTAIQVARLTGAGVLAIDRDEKAVEAASCCIKALKLENLVEVKKADGTEPLSYPFNVALVALQAEPKRKLIDNLMAEGKPSARLVFRSPREELSHQYDLLPREPLPVGEVTQNQVTFNKSVLYQL